LSEKGGLKSGRNISSVFVNRYYTIKSEDLGLQFCLSVWMVAYVG